MLPRNWARLKYQQIKYELAEQAHQDRKKYAELKEENVNDFIDTIIEREKTNAQHRFGNMTAEVLL